MKIIVFGLMLGVLSISAETLDLSSLDKLSAKAKEVNSVTLDPNQLKVAVQLMQENAKKDKDPDFEKLAAGLRSVMIRNFEFDKPGAYSDADLNAVRRQFAAMRDCSKVIDSKEEHEHSEIYLCSKAGNAAGIGIIAAEETELTVVFVDGAVAMKDLGKLNGFMSMPSIRMKPITSQSSNKSE